MRRIAALLVSILAASVSPSARAACDIVVGDIEGLAIAVDDPANEVICLGGDIEGTLDLGFGALFEDRNFEIRSVDPETPVTWSADPAQRAHQNNLIVCDPEAKVTLRLHHMILDGEGYPAIAMVANMCSLEFEGLTIRDFEPGEGLAALELPGDLPRATEITRCWFEDIRGTAIRVYGGLLEVTQSAFVGGHSSSGPGALDLRGSSQTASRGTLYWGNSSEVAGGAVAGEESAYLHSGGDAFVANRAPMGGAIYWDTFNLTAVHGLFAGNVTCEPDESCQLGPGDLVAPAQSLDSACNFSMLDIAALEIPALDVAPGIGAGLMLTESVQKAAINKCGFLSNDAGGGNGGAIAWFRTDPSGPPPGERPQLHLLHNTFTGNKSSRGGAFWGDESNNGGFFSLGNLWLDHAGPAVVLEGMGWNPLLAANHTDGESLLETGGGPLIEMDETRGEEPGMQVCPTGCGDASLEALCGVDETSIELSYAFRPSTLHFGVALCPEPGDPWLEGTGLDLPELAMPDGSVPDRGLTGLSCLGAGLSDLDSDNVPDFADCAPSNEGINPFEVETCNGMDDNCNDVIDEGVTQTWYMDQDGDGFGSEPVEVCHPEDRMVDNQDDCDDGNSEVHPGSTEVYGDQLDNDCDGTVDLDSPGCHSAGCLAARVAPGDEGLEISDLLSPGPLLALAGTCVFARRRIRG